MSREPALTPSQARYVRRAAVLRKKLTNEALAKKYNRCPRTIERYARETPKRYQAQQ